MEFTPINTQEEFDARVTEVYGDIQSLQNQVKTLTGERDAHATTITDLQNQIKGFQDAALRQKVAREKNLPIEMADRLTGESEDDIRKDADALAKLIRAVNGAAPLFDPEQPKEDTNRAGLREMLRKMKGE